nr:rust resistance kinase lr10 [Quercus suber]
MDISHRIVIQTLLFFVLFILDLGEGQDGCPVLRCGEYGPDIRFPFRFKDRQPDHCGYPGFDLYCNDKNDTVLKLPTSIITFVNSIDYESQFIKVTVSDVYCFPRDILNLSSSPFQFQDFLYDYALFNCTGTRETGVEHYSRIDCLSSSRHPVYAFRPDDNIDYLPILSCTKMYTVSSVAYVWDDYSVEWRWSEPKCGFCERKGEKCRFKNNTKIFETECFNLTRNKYKDNKGTKIVTTVSILGSFLLALAVYAVHYVYHYDKTEKEDQARIEKFLDDYKALKPTSSKGNGEEFINEVGTMGRIHHVNAVRLVGFCADGYRRALVYEFLPNDSLEKFISSVDSNHFLGWEKLRDIAHGIAKGIEYLHQGCDQRILHFDIKPHNILLDQNFNPKISDFGLAKLCAKDQNVVSMTTTRGTMGYVAPEVFSRNFGNVSYKSDVTVLEYCCLKWLEKKEDLRVYVEDNGDAKIAKKLAIVGLWCIQWHPVDHPSMKVVVQMLEREGDNLTMPPNPFASTGYTRINASTLAWRLNLDLEVIPELE